MPWLRVTIITILAFILFYLRMVSYYGVAQIGNDLYVHFLAVIIYISVMVYTKELLDRLEFANLILISNQEKHWQ